MTLVRTVLATLALPTALAAQTQPAFEVASIRPSPEQVERVNIGVHITGSQVRIARMSLKDYVGIAFRAKPHQCSGPDWLGQTRFDIAATIPEGVPPSQVPEMLQRLLTDRFGMQVHREAKEMPVYALLVAKGGLKVSESKPPAGPPPERPAGVNVTASGNAGGVGADMGDGSSFSLAENHLEIRNMTMAAVAELLTRFADRPVVDSTGVSGRYDLDLALSPEDYRVLLIRSAVNAGVTLPPQALRVLDGASGDPISPALASAGLQWESRRAPIDIVVIDSMAKTPTEN